MQQLGTFSNLPATVTNSSAQLLKVNARRQYLLIQNNDPVGSVYIGFGNNPVTAGIGLKIRPGGSYEMMTLQTTQAIQAIGDIASNANVIVIEA